MTIVQPLFTSSGKLHIARPTQGHPGYWTLACSGRAIKAVPMGSALEGNRCAKCAGLTVEELAR